MLYQLSYYRISKYKGTNKREKKQIFEQRMQRYACIFFAESWGNKTEGQILFAIFRTEKYFKPKEKQRSSTLGLAIYTY